MNNIVKKLVLSEHTEPEEFVPISNSLAILNELEIECTIRLGHLNMRMDALRQLKKSQILMLEQKTSEPVDILINHQVIARGEIMACDEQFAVKITEVFA